MEEYIRELLEQIRFEKAHKAIGDEIRSHIEDQIEANVSEGMDNETAEKRAVEDMGNPIEVGISLDRVHRPRFARGVVIAAILVGVIGIIIHVFISKDGLLKNLSYQYSASESRTFIIYTVLGIAAMLFMYLVDYTTVAKYSKSIAGVLIAFYLVSFIAGYYCESMPWVIRLNRNTPIILEGDTAFYSAGMVVNVFSFSLTLLLIPLYAGILYKYRGQSYAGLVKALLWIFIPRILPLMYVMSGGYPYMNLLIKGWYYNVRAFILAISMLIQLSYAIKKDWIKVRKLPSLISIWLFYVAYLAYFMYIGYKATAPSNDNFRKVLDSLKLIGSGSVSLWGGESSIQTRAWVTFPESNFVLTYVSAAWGLLVGLVVVMIVVALIVFGFVAISKSKNQLGQAMGIGCMMWLAINAIANIVVGFGIIPAFYASFFPFISNGNIIISYVFLGILVSVYKYKDAYAQHVDIRRRRKEKGLEEKI